MVGKQFISSSIRDIFYQIVGEGWIDNSTFVVAFQNMIDRDGDTFHIETEYHKDTDEITFTRVYDDETLDGSAFVSPCFKRQIEEYIFSEIGLLREDSFLTTQNIVVELKLDVPKNMSIGDFNQWLSDIAIEVKSPNAEKVRVLGVTNKGRK